ncbi:type III pantothenate kinase [Desulfuribacillus alkaliarsenatis]|uniref:Type III pantothenate kinase n=1 Tax=Desulfuribacillus alkaliarsenatis TaxID=766136 RepID=A0A1E5FYY5_9FIRM|nr:type III pantothenate kinase [Desulfuribacillus alkaliarsenatis]OEF95780.1 pantothenate kinase [Desulfuribacillus alkaliarsenatis]
MLLVMDVGNTNIVLGMYEGKELRYHWRIATSREKTEDEYGILIKNLLGDKGLELKQIKAVIISSVVPPLMFALERMVEIYLKLEPIVVGPGIRTSLNINIDNPREVGADRIVNAVAAIHEYGAPLIVVDFGTATTFCAIDDKGSYLGGAIAPGIRISTEALFARAAKLPRIELVRPSKVIGKNTVASMQSGIINGYIGQLDGIVRRMKTEMGYDAVKVVATGGLAELIAVNCETVDIIDEFLTLKGLRILYEKNNEKLNNKD